jgi:nucleotide-binding universal stress UspA family protein
MKTIFAATDFTQAAHNACVYAASLAREFKARLVLFSAYEPIPFPITEVPFEYNAEDMKAPTELRLAKAAEALQVAPNEVVIETMCREGIIINEIISAARETKADIIVAGMKDKGKGLRKIFGSTVTALARKSDLPAKNFLLNCTWCELSKASSRNLMSCLTVHYDSSIWRDRLNRCMNVLKAGMKSGH